MFNSVILMGRAVREPEVKLVGAKETPICNLTLAVERPKMKGQEQTADFIYCTAFGKVAEIIGNNITKGNRVLVNGRLQIDKYTGKDGIEKTLPKVMVNTVTFVEKKTDSKQSAMDSFADGQAATEEEIIF